MKKIILSLAIAFVFPLLGGAGLGFAQAPNDLWAKSAVGSSNDYGNSCSTDASGNIIAIGYFYSSSITLGTFTLTNADATGNTHDIFIVKYDPSGNVLWAKSAGGTSWDYGYSCSADANGNIIVTGNFHSPSLILGTTTLTNVDATGNTADIFIVKYDPSGNVLWAKSAGGTIGDYGQSCATDASGNIIATGYFYSSSITFGTTTLTNGGANTTDIFIVKYDPSGNVLWAKSAVGSSNDYGNSCSTDASGNIIAIGYFRSTTISFGTFTLTNADATGNTYDIFIVKYGPNGNLLWAKSAGGTIGDYGQSCATDASGNIIATGYFKSTSITFGTTTLTNGGANTTDIFIVKYDPSGNVLWAKSAVGSSNDYGNSCSADASGNIITTGYFQSSSITFGTTTLTNAGSTDIFIVKYDPSGNVLWAKSAGGTGGDEGKSCSTDASGNIIVTGYFFSPSITFGTTTLASAGSADIFIVKLCQMATPTVSTSGATTFCTGGSVTLTSSSATSYSWSNGATAQSITVTAQGNYSVIVNTNGCSATSSVISVMVNPTPTVCIGTNNPVCAGQTINFNYCGSAVTSYNWTGPGAFSATSASPSITNASAAATGTYSLSVTDANGCTQSGTTNIIVSPTPTVTVNAATICLGASATLTATGASTYLWNTSATTNTISVSPATTTVYTVTGTTSGCNNAVTTTVTVNPIPNVTANATATVICIGTAVTLTGGGATTYTWTGSVSNGVAFSPSSTQTYTVTGTDGNGCVNTASKTITVNPLPTVTANATSTLLCAGTSETLTGSGANTYVWTGGVTNGVPFTVSSSQTYTVTGTDGNGCSNSSSITINVSVPSAPDICMVTADSLSLNNVIVWDKTMYLNADTFLVYRDTANNNYALIGKIPKNLLSTYTDTARSIGAVNGDPNITTYRYKLAYKDSCGNISPKSPYHNTVYTYNTGSLFLWNHYGIEGQPTPVPALSSYALKRDNVGGTGIYVTAATAGASSTNINDPQYATYQTVADWRVETNWSIACTPSMRYGTNGIEATIIRAKSNITNNKTTGSSQLSVGGYQLKVYPNPGNGSVTISSSNVIDEIIVTGVLGNESPLRPSDISPKGEKIVTLDVRALQPGIYFVTILSGGVKSVKKLLIEK